jgi:hypothetical protein
MTRAQVDNFEKTQSQLEALHSEVSALSKKAQNDALSKFKLKFVNQILIEANRVLDTRYKPFPSFDVFDEDDIPTNSDVAMVISQYLGCMEKLRVDNIHENISYIGGKVRKVYWYWKDTTKETHPPTKIK